MLTDEASPMRRSVDKNTQRGMDGGGQEVPSLRGRDANLTKEKYQQFTVLRLQSPEGDQPPDGKWCS